MSQSRRANSDNHPLAVFLRKNLALIDNKLVFQIDPEMPWSWKLSFQIYAQHDCRATAYTLEALNRLFSMTSFASCDLDSDPFSEGGWAVFQYETTATHPEQVLRYIEKYHETQLLLDDYSTSMSAYDTCCLSLDELEQFEATRPVGAPL